jgi:outer membrane protein
LENVKPANAPARIHGPGLVFALLWFSVFPAAAAETLELKDAIALALRQNPQLLASQYRVEQASAAMEQARGARLPKVTLSLSATRTDDPLGAFGFKLSQSRVSATDFTPTAINNPSPINNFNTRVQVEAPLYTGGLITGAQEQAGAFVEAAQEGDEAARQQVVFHVIEAYEGVHSARAFMGVAKQAEAAAAEHVQVTEKLVRQGASVKSDLLSARVNLEEARLKSREAADQIDATLDRLRKLLGMAHGSDLKIGKADTLPVLAGSVEDHRASARLQNPRLIALRHRIDAAQAQVKMAKSGKLPQVGVMARHDWNDRDVGLDAASYTLGAQVSWQVFDGGVIQGKVDRAAAEVVELEAQLADAEADTLLQVDDAWRRLARTQARLEAKQLAVADAEEAQRLVNLRYENGVATLVETLSAQAQLDKTRADRVAARYELTMAGAALRLAVGRLGSELWKRAAGS